jgi:hypothetical protein
MELLHGTATENRTIQSTLQITSRINERKAIFLDDEERERFLEILLDYHKRFGIFLHRGDGFR